MFKNAIVRPPGRNFADGLTTVDLSAPIFERALEQHARYCDALRECGLVITALEADLRFPDSTFVEDAAVLTERGAVLARPGAKSRQGEVDAIRQTVSRFFPAPLEIEEPGTLDGGDICEAGEHFFLGLSQRTNEEGVRQLGAHLTAMGYTSQVVDVRGMNGILHLKSGIAYIGENTLVVMQEMAGNEMLRGYKLLRVSQAESYAANCVRVNERVLVAAGFPRVAAELEARGFRPLPLEMSEFQKMDGGLSCLSLRF
ncbi:MAG TPA: arginine deiminase family protein [Terriglobales bacterium]|nr:arginine deiminase family protein [Terriglobales bacterium]